MANRLVPGIMSALIALLFGSLTAGAPETPLVDPTLLNDCVADGSCLRRLTQNSSNILPIGKVKAGTVSFHKIGGLCGNGEDAYFGYVEPTELTHPDKIFIEMMGGAVCFNKTSCEDEWLSRWMSVTKYLKEKEKLTDLYINVLKSGFNLDFKTFKSLGGGYLPDGENPHPMDGRRGLYFVTCTGDVSMGRHNVTYEGGTVSYHHGGLNFKKLLDDVKEVMPNINDFAIYGGSGGGVGASAWVTKIADMWPMAKVSCLVDSGFHMMPGSHFFNFFWDHVAWSPGPSGQHSGKHDDVEIPTWDWREEYNVANALARYDGRVRVAYLACDEDNVVAGDRRLMSQYSAFDGSTIHQLEEMWNYATNLHKCAPAGTVYTYISHCTRHHITRNDFPAEVDLDGDITAKQFVHNFFGHTAPDPAEPDQAHFWFESHDAQEEGGACSAPTTTATSELPQDVDGALSKWSCPLRALCLIIVTALAGTVL